METVDDPNTGPGPGTAEDGGTAPTRYDMIALPRSWGGGYASEYAFQMAVREKFGPMLGIDTADGRAKLHFRRREGNPPMVFVSTDGEEMPIFAKNHPQFPLQNRHEWTDLGDGVSGGVMNRTARAETEVRIAGRSQFRP